MDILIKVGQLLLSLSILIVLHELGHFVFARIFKTRVEKFYLFFNWGFSLFKFKKGETEYGIGWLPLGGYVKISGMIDESMDKEAMKQPPKPYEFRSKPSWQRLLIMLGGVIVNFILGFIIYTLILFKWGGSYLPAENMTGGVWVQDTILTNVIGLETGDKIISINEEEPEKFSDILMQMFEGGKMLVNRNGSEVNLTIPIDFAGTLSTHSIKNKDYPLAPRIPFVVAKFAESSLNKETELKIQDQIVGVAGVEAQYFDQFPTILDTLKNKTVSFDILRDNEIKQINLQIDSTGKIGVYPADLKTLNKLGLLVFEIQKYTFWQSIPAGFKHARDKLTSYIGQFKLIFNFKTGAHKGIGGFAAIGNLFPAEWDWQTFWEITAFLSLMLAFLNVLPIPALDGGHVMFLLFEMVTGRKPSEKFLEYAQIVGMVLLLFLLIYANGNDIYRAIVGR